MTREYLLKQSIKEFQDYSNKALLVPMTRVINKQGFTYLVLDKEKARELSCAIHFNREYTITEEIGRLHTTSNIDLSTREPLDIQNSLLIYKNKDTINKRSDTATKNEPVDMYIFAKSFDGYNETMKQYMYSCEALTCDKEGTLHELHDVYGHSSFDVLSELENHIVLPFYADVEPFVDKCAILRIDPSSQETLSMRRLVDGRYKQLMKDSVQFTLLHYSRYEAMQFLRDLENLSLTKQKFGFASTPRVSEFEDLHEASALRGMAIKIEVDISYCLNVESNDTEKRIAKAYFTLQS